MSAPVTPAPPGRMTSAEFLAWAAREDIGRVDLIDGEVVAMGGETILHNLAKRNVDRVLDAALGSAPAPCRIYVDGVAVSISEDSIYIPDVLVDCGTVEDFSAMTAAKPVIVVEILSQSTWRYDVSIKLNGYFTIASIQHYLLVDPEGRRVIHHRRQGDEIVTTLHGGGSLSLDPPGVTVDVDGFWHGLPEGADETGVV